MRLPCRLYRWDEIALEKITEMVSRKFISGERETMAQIFLKRGAIVPRHSHESEQMTYVLQGALKLLVAGEAVRSVGIRRHTKELCRCNPNARGIEQSSVDLCRGVEAIHEFGWERAEVGKSGD